MQANSELLIFITPYVIETTEEMLPEARQEQEKALAEAASSGGGAQAAGRAG